MGELSQRLVWLESILRRREDNEPSAEWQRLVSNPELVNALAACAQSGEVEEIGAWLEAWGFWFNKVRRKGKNDRVFECQREGISALVRVAVLAGRRPDLFAVRADGGLGLDDAIAGILSERPPELIVGRPMWALACGRLLLGLSSPGFGVQVPVVSVANAAGEAKVYTLFVDLYWPGNGAVCFMPHFGLVSGLMVLLMVRWRSLG
jgi:hypothetical protein